MLFITIMLNQITNIWQGSHLCFFFGTLGSIDEKSRKVYCFHDYIFVLLYESNYAIDKKVASLCLWIFHSGPTFIVKY